MNEQFLGPHVYGNCKQEEEYLLDFCVKNHLTVENSGTYKQVTTRYVWVGKTKKTIDCTDQHKNEFYANRFEGYTQ